MNGIPVVVTPARPQLDRLLLETKITIPPPARDGFVSRADLIAAAHTDASPIVAVTAPAGYGKTSLLAQWAAMEDRAVGWVSLDRFDDDPVTLLALLASAFVKATGADPAIIADMRVHSTAALGRAAPRLASTLRASGRPFVLMVDDLHVLRSPACHDVLTVVTSGIPTGSQFVGASRTVQPYVQTRRPSGGVREFGAGDLALDADGARRIFRQERIELTGELAQKVIDRTEGWAVGIQLAAVIARDTDDPEAIIRGDDRYVADYLYAESLASLPADTQHALRRIAVLDDMCEDLCRAVLDDPAQHGLLRELENSSVFLMPRDRTRRWYRYHPLFREFLLGELRREDPDLIPTLHLRAARWYESHDSPEMAVEHLLQTDERGLCATMIASVGLTTYRSGGMATLQRWLARLGDDAIRAYPPLAAICGWTAVLSGNGPEADRWAAVVEQAAFDGPPADGSASFESARAMLRSAMCAHGPEQMMADAEFAVAAEPTWSPWRDQAMTLLGEALLLQGQWEQADVQFAAASARAREAGHPDVQILSDSERAMIAMDRGRWEHARELVDAARASIEGRRMHDYASSVLAFAGAARLALHRGDTKDAERELTRAMRARPVSTYALPSVAVRFRIHLSSVHWVIGDHATSRHLVREIDDILMHRPELGTLVDQVDSLRAMVRPSAAAAAGMTPLTPAELRLLPYLQTHLTIPEIGARLFVSKNTVGTEVGSIYRKLGVSTRSEAVERGISMGLLGG
ncbi:MAG: AAA family ATPase [Microbacterium sp.]